MSGRRDESLVLDDLVGAAARIVHVAGAVVASGELGQNPDVDEVVLWNLSVLGEASKRLSAVTRDRFPDIPWSQLARTRDLIVHHYEGIQWAVVGEICKNDLPSLIPVLEAIRDQLREESASSDPPTGA